MSDWTAGYVADIGYTYGYYTELNPLRVKLAFLNQGLVYPESGTACELGFGQGLSTNFHAAASVTHWYGTDFNPSQAGFAQELAAASGAHAKLYDEAFAEFAARDDLPEFDYIGLHGIWSWISDENRLVIVDFIRRKLKVGGVLYISYNTLPGWTPFVPLRHLLTEHAEIMAAEGQGIVKRIDGAIDFVSKLVKTNPIYVAANPLVPARLTQLQGQNRSYLAHEYFNRDWHPMHYATMQRWLAPAKVEYACSANFLDHVNEINLSAEQQQLLNEITDPDFRETVRDFIVNQQFRKDYWVKGKRTLSPLEQVETLREQKVILTTHRNDVSLTVKGSLGEAEMNEAVYIPLLDLLADHKPRTLGQIETKLQDAGVNYKKLMQAVMVLMGAGHLALVQDDLVISKAKKLTDRLNALVIKKARSAGEVNYLASPVTGGGYGVGRFGQLFILALQQGKRTPEEWAHFVWQLLATQGQRIQKDGATLHSEEENLAELNTQAKEFSVKTLPILKALQIA